MIKQNKTSTEIAMDNNVLCNKNVLHNALRPFRSDKRVDQTRELRDTVRSSDLWNSRIILNSDNIFMEMFFINRHLLSMRMKVEFVFVDDTACTNVFAFPLIAVLCRSDSGHVHAVAWGFIRNRTTQSFCNFFTFLQKYHPTIQSFMCDRHHAQSRAIKMVYGEDVHVFSALCTWPGTS